MKYTSKMFSPVRGQFILGILGFAVIAFTGQTLAQGDSWQTKASRVTATTTATAGVIDGKLYVVGGNVGGLGIDVVEAYDPVSDTWTTKTPIPAARLDAASGVIAGKLYVVGGGNPIISQVDIYDPVANSWSTAATPMLDPRAGVGAGVIDGILYVVGGDVFGQNASVNTLRAYTPGTDSWQFKASMPSARQRVAVGVIDGKLYAAGGFSTCCAPQTTLDIYDPVFDTWTTAAPLPVGKDGLVGGVIDGKFYVVTGLQAGPGVANVHANETFEYDPTADAWVSRSPNPTARWAASAGVIDGKLYVVGGSDLISALTVLEVYTPPVTAVDNFSYADFSDTTNINLAGSANKIGNIIQITPETGNQHGAVWHVDRHSINTGFSTRFNYQINNTGVPADGMAFVIQDASNSVVSTMNGGAGMGYQGISPGILAVEFDTHSDSQIGIEVRSSNPLTIGGGAVTAVGSAEPNDLPGFDLADGVAREATIRYTPNDDPSLSILTVFIGDPGGNDFNKTYLLDLSTLLADDGMAHIGFTSATGGSSSEHQLNSWSFGLDGDGDGVPDTEDAFPLDPTEWLDSDGDGTGNNADTDDDNDGVPDTADAFPLDPTKWLDDEVVQDSDKDGLSNIDEENIYSTNPNLIDSDFDGVNDGDEVALKTNPNLIEFHKIIGFEDGLAPAGMLVDDSATTGWIADNSTTSQGKFSYKANAITNGQSAQTGFWANFSGGQLAFDAKLSTQASFAGSNDPDALEGLAIYVDGDLAWITNGELDWFSEQIFISTGLHHVNFVYFKNSDIQPDDETVWIDNIQFDIAEFGLNADMDEDGLIDTKEVENNALIWVADTDSDGLLDGFEVNVAFSDPAKTDTDEDGLTDGEEVNTHFTSPIITDTDFDGFSDFTEVSSGTNPLDPDSFPEGAVQSIKKAESTSGGSIFLVSLFMFSILMLLRRRESLTKQS